MDNLKTLCIRLIYRTVGRIKEKKQQQNTQTASACHTAGQATKVHHSNFYEARDGGVLVASTVPYANTCTVLRCSDSHARKKSLTFTDQMLFLMPNSHTHTPI